MFAILKVTLKIFKVGGQTILEIQYEVFSEKSKWVLFYR